MTSRQKTGIGFIVAGIVAFLAGGTFIITEINPEWVDVVIQLGGVIAGVFGVNLSKEKV